MLRPAALALSLLPLLVAAACRTASPVEGLRRGEHARTTDALFPGVIPTDDEGRPTHVVTRIVDARTGAPLPGAHLGLILGCGHTPDVRSAVTDEEGRFLVAGLDPRDSLGVFADPDDEETTVAWPYVPPGHEMTIHLPPPGEEYEEVRHEVRVRILDSAGAPVEDVYVHAVREGDHHTEIAWRQDEGSWVFRPPAGDYTLFVNGADGPFADATIRLRVPLDGSAAPTVTLASKPTVCVTCEGFPDEAQRERSDFRTTVLLATETGERDVTDLVLANEPVPVPAAAPWAFFVRVGDQEHVILGPEQPSDAPIAPRTPRSRSATTASTRTRGSTRAASSSPRSRPSKARTSRSPIPSSGIAPSRHASRDLARGR